MDGKMKDLNDMYALFASFLFVAAFFGSLALIAMMLRDKADVILTALAGEHVPLTGKLAPVRVHTPRHAPRTQRRLAPPPSPAMIRRAAVA